MELVRPFVFRRHLDFSAFASMRDLHAQIRHEVSAARHRRQHQARARRHPRDRVHRPGVPAHSRRARRGAALRADARPCWRCCSSAQPAAATRPWPNCTDAYVFLRNLEHRLQYLDDQQTQTLPAARRRPRRDRRSNGLRRLRPRSLQALDAHRAQRVRGISSEFSPTAARRQHPLAALWQDARIRGRDAWSSSPHSGFRRAARRCSSASPRCAASGRYREMPAASQARLDRLVPLAHRRSRAAHADPDATLERVLQLLESISRRDSYLALLLRVSASARAASRSCAAPARGPRSTSRSTRSCSTNCSTRARCTQRPTGRTSRRPCGADLDAADTDAERQMDILRHFKQAQTLRLLAQDLAGTLPLETLSDHLSDLAVRDPARSDCASPGAACARATATQPRFAIVGYGKLGGKELGYASDLDLIFLYDDAAPEAPENYARLAQRINTWLTSMTPAGVLYETDLRLRPDGASGLLVSPLDAFDDYQRKKAWVWEHQALTRARFVAGDARHRRGLRGAPHRGAARSRATSATLQRRGTAMRGKDAGRPPQPQRRCSTSSTTAAASSTSNSSCSTWCSGYCPPPCRADRQHRQSRAAQARRAARPDSRRRKRSRPTPRTGASASSSTRCACRASAYARVRPVGRARRMRRPCGLVEDGLRRCCGKPARRAAVEYGKMTPFARGYEHVDGRS